MQVLIVVDMQNDFVTGPLGTAEAQAIVPAVAEKIRAARAAGAQVFFTRDTHADSYLSTQEGAWLPVPHCIQDTPGWEILPALSPDGDTVIDKPAFGSFALVDAVRASGTPAEIALCGVCTDICVLANAILFKTAFPEVRVIVDAAACAGVTPASHRNALRAMTACQIEIANAETA